jgi:hypothetical protein
LFNNVILLSTREDGFVPFHSARVELAPETATDKKLGKVYTEMVQNIVE